MHKYFTKRLFNYFPCHQVGCEWKFVTIESLLTIVCCFSLIEVRLSLESGLLYTKMILVDAPKPLGASLSLR